MNISPTPWYVEHDCLKSNANTLADLRYAANRGTDNPRLLTAAPLGAELAELVLQYAREFNTLIPDATLKKDLRTQMFKKALEFKSKLDGRS